MAYSCCFSLSKNLDFLDFLKKRFITSTIGGGLVISEHALYVDYLSLNPADTKSYFCIVAKLRNKIKKSQILAHFKKVFKVKFPKDTFKKKKTSS